MISQRLENVARSYASSRMYTSSMLQGILGEPPESSREPFSMPEAAFRQSHHTPERGHCDA